MIPPNQELIETLGQVKDAIGEWHDWQQLLTIARENLQPAIQVQADSVAAKNDTAKTQACNRRRERRQEADSHRRRPNRTTKH